MTKTTTHFEELFKVLDETAKILQEKLEIPYLEALIETGENMFQQDILQPVDDIVKKKLNNEYEKEKLDTYNAEQIRKAFQLAILKGMKEGTQPHHEMTPDAVAIFVSYLVNKLRKNDEVISVFDPAIGTGNLMTTVMNNSDKQIQAFGTEVDETLIKICYANANLQQHHIELFHQDSLKPLYISPCDFVLSDLPIGYYPNEQVAKKYELKAQEGLSFVHYLMIEQSLKYVKDEGLLVFIVPNMLFEGKEAENLNKFIRKKANVIGLLQLPLSLFKNEKFAKSIFILQKKGEQTIQPKQALIASLPKFSNEQAMQKMMLQLNDWFAKEWK
jgi:site-specific DNA-methyltransferase (adenine-specific)